MVPAISHPGRSFRGAALYFLHDKGEPGDERPQTSARVAWTLTLNLPTDDPDHAWRIMAFTAGHQYALKAKAVKRRRTLTPDRRPMLGLTQI